MIFLLKGKLRNLCDKKKKDKGAPWKIYLPGIWEPLTAWSGISENLTVAELLIKLPVFCGTIRFIACQLVPFLDRTNADHVVPPFAFYVTIPSVY
jgi:hypothetical protein